MVLSTALAFFALASAPIAQEADPWEELAAIFDDAVVLWTQEAMAAHAGGRPFEEVSPHPAVDMWPDFAELAASGDARAVIWMLQKIGDARLEERERTAEIGRVFALVRDGGTEPWVGDAVLALVELRDELDARALEKYLDSLISSPGPDAVRAAALVARAALVGDEEAARALRVRAAVLHHDGRDLAAGEPQSSATIDALGEALVDAQGAASGAWFQESFKPTEDGVYFQAAAARPDPELLFRPMLESLAESGSSAARLWVLTQTGSVGDGERAKLREHLERLAAEGVDAEGIGRLRYYVSWLASQLGAEFVESRMRILVDGVDEEQRAGLLLGLGEALCENADDDEELHARGLAILTEVGERWPGSEEATDAAGQRFRFENLVVGKVIPDFESEDVDGVPFKLSDYRGKVTVLDFWGFW